MSGPNYPSLNSVCGSRKAEHLAPQENLRLSTEYTSKKKIHVHAIPRLLAILVQRIPSNVAIDLKHS